MGGGKEPFDRVLQAIPHTSLGRICPGRNLSSDSLSLMVLTVLAFFDIKPAIDDDGNAIPLSLSVTPTLIAFVPFPSLYLDHLSLPDA